MGSESEVERRLSGRKLRWLDWSKEDGAHVQEGQAAWQAGTRQYCKNSTGFVQQGLVRTQGKVKQGASASRPIV
jgi:hypothetical protein